MEELESKANICIPKDLSSEAANKYLLDACERFNVKCPPPHTTTRVLDKVMIFMLIIIYHVSYNDCDQVIKMQN